MARPFSFPPGYHPTPEEAAAERRKATAILLSQKHRQASVSEDEKTITYHNDDGTIHSIISVITDTDGKFLHLDGRRAPLPPLPAESPWDRIHRLYLEAEQWNLHHPVGTHVIYQGRLTVTRGPVFALGDSHLITYIRGVRDFVALAELELAEEPPISNPQSPIPLP